MHNKETPRSSIQTETSHWKCSNDMCRPSYLSRLTANEQHVTSALLITPRRRWQSQEIISHLKNIVKKAWNQKHWPHSRNKPDRQNTNLQHSTQNPSRKKSAGPIVHVPRVLRAERRKLVVSDVFWAAVSDVVSLRPDDCGALSGVSLGPSSPLTAGLAGGELVSMAGSASPGASVCWQGHWEKLYALGDLYAVH